jgi:carbonic anhydrase
LHFHSPSEHTFDGKYYDMEMHIVHQDYNSDKLAVIAVFFDMEKGGNQSSPFIDSLNIDEVGLSTIFK